MKYCLFLYAFPIALSLNSDETALFNDFIKAENIAYVTVVPCSESKIQLKRLYSINGRIIIFDLKAPNSDREILHSNVFLFDASCKEAEDVLSQISLLKLFERPHRWFLFHLNSSSYDFVEKLNVYIDSGFVVAERINSSYILSEFYKLGKNGSLIVNSIAQWNSSERFVFYKSLNDYSRRKDLKRTVIRIPIVLTKNESLQYWSGYRRKHLDTLSRVTYLVFHHLLDMINGSGSYIMCNSWGYIKDGYVFNEMIGVLQQQKGDIGGTAGYITFQRLHAVDYLMFSTPTRWVLIFRQPPLSSATNIYTLPFSKTVWICTVLLVLFSGSVLYFSVCWEQSYDHDTSAPRTWTDVAMITLGAVCQQGADVEPRSISGRITAFLIFLILMFMYTSYSACIVALLQSSTNSILTLRDLLDSRFQVGVEDTVTNHFYFSTATEPVRKAIYERKVAPPGERPHFLPLEEGIKKVRLGLYAFNTEMGIGYQIVSNLFYENEKCGMHELSFMPKEDLFVMIPKKSVYKEIFSISLSMIRERGIWYKEYNSLYVKKPECHGRGSTFVSVTLSDCYTGLVVIGCGILLSLVVLMVEILTHKYLATKNYNSFSKYGYFKYCD